MLRGSRNVTSEPLHARGGVDHPSVEQAAGGQTGPSLSGGVSVGHPALLGVDAENDRHEDAERDATDEHGGDGGQDEDHADHCLS
jgi:hypothetical protein